MAIYLKKFETQAAYEAAESSLILPNVSLTVDNNTVHYNPSTPPTPPTPTHDYVEIGGIKWATMNVGANSITDTGLYFQWADTQGYTAAQVGEGEGQKYFGQDDCIYYDTENYSYTKYNSEDGLITLQATDDAVKAAWGGNWRMPTKEEYTTLLSATTSAWTADYQGSGVAGVVLTDNGDNSKTLFFPACGYAREGSKREVGDYGYYWSSSIDTIYSGTDVHVLFFGSNFVFYDSSTLRAFGCPVRGILDA